MAKFQINILGCGSASSTLKHFPSCQVLDIRDNLFMIDCGESAQLQMRKMQLKFSRLNNIFISHLHGDHCFGLPGLVSTMGLIGKTGTLKIHIFKDGAEQFGNLFNYFCREMPFNIEFNIIKMERAIIYEDDAITVTTIPLKHRVPAVGFLFEEKPKLRHINRAMCDFHNIPQFRLNSLRDGSDYIMPDGTTIPNATLTNDPDPAVKYAYCSDTSPAQKIIPIIKGVDWLYHEATFAADSRPRAKQTGHSTTAQAAEVAKEAGVKNLIIGHFSSRYNDSTPLLKEAQEIFPNTVLADEELRIDIL